MKAYLWLILIYSLANMLGTFLYFLAIVVAAFSVDSGPMTFLTFLILYVPIFLVHLILLLITLAIRKITLPPAKKVLFAGAYMSVVLTLYSWILFTHFI
ncbi:hypothetical protein ACFP7A_06280 [Sporolactobacillus kofuensis]|uniref:Uncharacterized protein n=1 Tax=Sporolactobacillus kofuensis TaxID=269672 RepID=A0ABW1WDE6_9BACL|nr:hypothetical protein [Sporolactobacillus kofuensis]MCO7175488.1 hypothetical protein [Sporolactobacillus kofuensis]